MKKIEDYKFISTGKGDKGKSRNYSNKEYSKSDLLFEVLGNIDELSSILGVLYHHADKKEEIQNFQKTLQDINSLIATSDENVRMSKLSIVSINDISYLEVIEQRILKHSEIKPEFVLPGSNTSIVGSYYDLARSITRRAERSLVKFMDYYSRDDLGISLKYINRLSDLLFIYARSYAGEHSHHLIE